MGTFKRIVKYALAYWHLYMIAFIALILLVFMNVLIPQMIKLAVDEGIIKRNLDYLSLIAIAVVAISIVKGISGFTQRFFQVVLGERVVRDIRNDLFNSLQAQSHVFYDYESTGNLMSRATVDVDVIRRFFAFGVRAFVLSILTFTFVFVILFSMSIPLALLTFIFVPAFYIVADRFSKVIRPLFYENRKQFGQLTAVLQENIVGQRIVKSFSTGDFEIKKFEEENKKYLDLQLTVARERSTHLPAMIAIMNIATAVVLYFGAVFILQGELTIGELIAYFSYVGLLVQPTRFLGFSLAMYSRAISSGERVFEIIEIESEIKEKEEPFEIPKEIKGKLEFRKVDFHYKNHQKTLDGLNLVCEPNSVTAILGATGSGKTSLVNLIPRFYEVERGQILIDDIDIKNLKLKSLRRQIGVVAQDSFLFSASIRDNIAFGSPNASLEDVISAAKAAKIHEFISNTSDGYNSEIGERGVTLSGGQKQRVSIARALLYNPKIVILDASTSSVDTGTERAIMDALNVLLKDRTTVIITQRLSTARNADKIVVLRDGAVAEEGPHLELLEKDGLYSEMWVSQSQREEQLPIPIKIPVIKKKSKDKRREND